MLLSDILSSALRALLVNRHRSLLTMLGVIIGVGSVVLMISLGATFQTYILDQVSSFGTNTLDIIPKGFEKFGADLTSLSVADEEAIRALSTVDRVVPVIIVGKPVSYGREEVSPMVMGATSEIFGNYGLTLDHGRLLDTSDDEGASSVAVLAHQTALDLFGNVNPVGKKISIGEFSFTVIGTLKGLGSFLLQDLDKPVFIPISSARAISGQKHLSYITLKTVGDPTLAKLDITLLLRDRHNIENPTDDPDKDDFIARSSEQVTSIISSVTTGLTAFLALVAAISLIVGGIGIMNIMLVAVTERTKEIGLRKALGARRRDILLQFLIEAILLTLGGGIIGLIGGMFIGWFSTILASKVLGDLRFIVSISSVIMGLGMALITGLVFGLYPARRAADLSPMEALRWE